MRTRFFLLCFAMTASIVVNGRPLQEDKTGLRMDEVVRFQVENNNFSGSVLVAKEDHILFSRSYGPANIEWNIPNTPATKYRIGSLTKQFTAAAILLLEEQGKLKIDEPVKTYWPGAPPAWDKVTIFHLLTHTSGITDGTRTEYDTLKLTNGPVEKTISYIRERPLGFEPGSQYSYSNYGYLLLGYLIERITGLSYADFLQQRIFMPLAMKDSGVDSNTAIIARRAAGYTPTPVGIVNASYVNMSFPHAAGAIYSTTEDLLRWTQGLFGGKLLSPVSLKKMTTPFKERYALGLIMAKDGNRDLIVHEGHIDGFCTALAYLPDEKMTIAVLSNFEDEDLPSRIGRQLSAIVHGETVVLPTERREIKLPDDSLRKFTGLYELDPSRNVIVALPNGKLTAQVGSGRQVELLAESASRFFSRSIDEQFDFDQNDQGFVTGLAFHLDGEERRARRVADRIEVNLPVQVLNRYAGTYRLSPEVDVIMTVEGDRLMGQPTGQYKEQLYAEAEDHFFLKTFNAQIEFIKNKDAEITGLIFRQAGGEMRAPRR